MRIQAYARRLSLLCLVSLWGIAAEAVEPFRNLDVFELEMARDVQISPDGKRIAYVRQAMDIMTDRARSNIWLVNVDGSGHEPLLSGRNSFSSPRWSPDGTRLAYVSSLEGEGPELYVRWLDTGQTALLSNLASAPGSIAWSPDGSQLAFTAFVASTAPKLATPPAAPKGAEWAPPVVVVDTVSYRSDGRGLTEPGFTHVFVIPAIGGSPRQLTLGNFNHAGRLAWSPDGTQLVVSANRNNDAEIDTRNTDLWSVDVRSGEMRQLTTRYGPDSSPMFSADGTVLAYLGYDDRKLGYQGVNAYVLDLGSGESSLVTPDLDRSIVGMSWAGTSNRSLVVSFDDRGKRVLAAVDLKGKVRRLVDDLGGNDIGRPYTSGGFSVASNGAIAYSSGSALRPADVSVFRADRPRQLTRLNDELLGYRELASVERITWASEDGDFEIEGWLALPPGFDPANRYPLMLEIHGGPFAAYGPHFSAEVQLYAAAGYVVLYANPRGSTSYGHRFANEIHLNYPGEDYLDLLAGVDAVIARGYIDESQLFVTGGSGGGVLTAWIVGKTDRFAAAAVAKPVINWTSHALYSDISTMVPQYWFDKPPWEDQANYWRRSPLSLVGQVSTPTMLITGEADQRTPMHESEQYYQALRLRQVPTALVRIPEAAHGIAQRPSHLIAKVDNILAWFARYRSAAPGP
ncbi:MAG: prolyl oligopeptidase family serine peptidase [Pseudomonadota bacterium]